MTEAEQADVKIHGEKAINTTCTPTPPFTNMLGFLTCLVGSGREEKASDWALHQSIDCFLQRERSEDTV